MFTKPCATPGCNGLCRAKTRSKLAERKHCTKPCYDAYMRRMGLSFVPGLTKVQRRAASRKGGLAGNVSRRKAAVQRRVEEVDRLVPHALLAKLPHHEQLLLKTLFARIYEQGRKVGMGYERCRRYRSGQARKQATAA